MCRTRQAYFARLNGGPELDAVPKTHSQCDSPINLKSLRWRKKTARIC